MQRIASENEHLLRMTIHHTALEPVSGKQPRRGTRRIDWIESALAVCAGIEALVVLRDVRSSRVA